MSSWRTAATLVRRLAPAAVVAGLLSSFLWAASAAHSLQSLRHLGPIGLVAGQEAIVTVANPTDADIESVVTLFDANAQVLARQNLTVQAHGSDILRWTAAGEVRVRATVETPGVLAARYPIALFLHHPSTHQLALVAEVNNPLRKPPTTAALSPYVPILAVAKSVVSVVNLASVSATFEVSFLDAQGDLVSSQTLVVAPRRTGVAQMPAPRPDGVRVEVQGPAGLPYLVSNEVVDEATGMTLALLLAH